MKILAINPGSLSTKFAVYEDKKPILVHVVQHTPEELAGFARVSDQYDFRRRLIVEALDKAGLPLRFDAVIGRGGLTKPVEGGVNLINDALLRATARSAYDHPCNLAAPLAHDLATIAGCPAFTADPGVVDELCPEARISGSPELPRRAFWHALNQKSVARRYAKSIGRAYEDLRLIVCHMGGGISIAAHAYGRAIDANNALDGEGPFSMTRCGSLPVADVIRLAFSGKYTEGELMRLIKEESGVKAHLGTSDMREVLRRIEQEDDAHARLVVEALIYQTAKYIAGGGAVLCGKVDAILLTGGMANEKYITDRIADRVSYLAPIIVFPGEEELKALASNALSVLRGECEARPYVE